MGFPSKYSASTSFIKIGISGYVSRCSLTPFGLEMSNNQGCWHCSTILVTSEKNILQLGAIEKVISRSDFHYTFKFRFNVVCIYSN